MEIRHGRMTREEGIEMVKRYDANEPKALEFYCEFLGITKQDFYRIVVPMRDRSIWKQEGEKWVVMDSVDRHEIGENEEKARTEQSAVRTLSKENQQLYYNPARPPEKCGHVAFDMPSIEPRWI